MMKMRFSGLIWIPLSSAEMLKQKIMWKLREMKILREGHKTLVRRGENEKLFYHINELNDRKKNH